MYDVDMVNRDVALLADRINTVLVSRDMSPAQLARDSGLSPGAISKVLNGKSQNVRGDTLARIAAALEVSVDYLQGISEDPSKAGGEPWPEYALELLEHMRRLDSVQNYTLLVTARALIEERESLRHLSVVDLVQAATDYYGGGAELKRFEEQLRLLEARRGTVGRIAAADEVDEPAHD